MDKKRQAVREQKQQKSGEIKFKWFEATKEKCVLLANVSFMLWGILPSMILNKEYLTFV